MNVSRLADLSKQIFTPGRSLLLPMLILALGVHAALLAMPIPSTEKAKEAEDKQNPITINQIPTEKPTASSAAATGSVEVPSMPTADSSSDAASSNATSSGDTGTTSTTATDTSADTTASDTTATSSTSTASSSSTTGSSKSAAATAAKSSTADSSQPADTSTESSPPPETESSSNTSSTSSTSTPSPEASPSAASASSVATTSGVTTNALAEFPHFQPSESDCYGLGFGDNCRIVENQEISQLITFFKKELPAKDFTAALITDEPTYKVFKLDKGDKTLYLNIWQGKDRISYLLSKVIVKQSPEEIKTEAVK